MNKKIVIISSLTVLIIAIAAIIIVTSKTNNSADKTDGNTNSGNISSVNNNADTLKGDAYDSHFISEMMAHHQGAVDMANQAVNNAQHQELKTLARAIVADQNKEMNTMKQWQKEWGYPSSSADDMQDHSSMSMMGDMSMMSDSLAGKTGDDFDKAFLEQMIIHHQSAIDMAKPADKQAKHKEVKNLAVNIIKAQSIEINQMKQWQKEWNY